MNVELSNRAEEVLRLLAPSDAAMIRAWNAAARDDAERRGMSWTSRWVYVFGGAWVFLGIATVGGIIAWAATSDSVVKPYRDAVDVCEARLEAVADACGR